MTDDGVERFKRIISERDVSTANLSFEGSTARLDFPDADLLIEFESAQDSPEASWKGGSMLLSASRILIHDGGETFEIPFDGATTITLDGVPRPDEWDD